MGGETALAMQGFGVGASTVGAYYNALGQKTTLDARAEINENNANLAEMSAQSALLTGQRQEQSVDLHGAQVKSSQRAAFAANGVDLSSTTPVSVLTSTDVLSQTDAATVAANAMRTAFGYQSQGLGYRNQALTERAMSKSINPFFSAAGSLVAGAGTVSESWYKLKKEGAFDKKTSSSTYGPQNDFFARAFGQHNLVSDALY